MDITIIYERAAVPIVVVRVRGDINAGTYEQLRDRVKREIDRGADRIVLDLVDVPRISSAAFRAFHFIFHVMRTDAPEDSDEAMRAGMRAGTYRSRHLAIARPTARVKELLQLAGIPHFIAVYDELPMALDALCQG